MDGQTLRAHFLPGNKLQVNLIVKVHIESKGFDTSTNQFLKTNRQLELFDFVEDVCGGAAFYEF